jgi:hypothetical protein
VRALTTNGKTLAMTNALEASDFDLALDVLLNIATEVTFNGDVCVYPRADAVDFILGEVANASALIESSGNTDLLCC